MKREADVTIVGNGAVACALAFVLADREPDATVALVGPRARPGSASLAAAAMLNAFAEAEPGMLEDPVARRKFETSVTAAALWQPHLDRVNARAGTSVTILRGTHVISHEEEDARFDALLAALRAFEEPFREVEPGSVSAPRRTARRAILIEKEGAVRSRALHDAYDLAFSRMKNVTVIDDEAVAVDSEKNVTLREGGTIASKIVVLAAGAHTRTLVRDLGLAAKLPRMDYGCGVAIVVEPRAPFAPAVIRTTGECVVFTVPYGDGLVYIGSTYHEEDHPAPLPRSGDVAGLLDDARARLDAGFEGVEVRAVLTGYRPTTADGLPLIGRTSIDGIWLATGTRRDGFHLSPLIARELASSFASKAQPFAGLFTPERILSAASDRASSDR